MKNMPSAVRRCTRILWPGKAAEKTPKGVITDCLREISQNVSRKKQKQKTNSKTLSAIAPGPLLPDATLSHMVKECRKLFSAFLCRKKRDQKSQLIRLCQFC
jgi:hypothetical protein